MGDRAQLLNDNEESLRLAMDGRLVSLWTSMPGIVQSVDLATMTLSVQPAIQAAVEDENGIVTYVNLPLLIHVPIQYPMAGGFALTLPVAVGDEVLVVWASRCIDSWWQSGGVQKPMEARLHDISDGFAILGISSIPNVLPNISADSAQLRNRAGTTYVEISGDGKVKIVSASEIDLNGPVKITGNVNVTGTIIASGEITGGPTAVPLSTHTHGGVTTGSGVTGVPIP